MQASFVNLFEFLVRQLGFRLFFVRNNQGRMKDRQVAKFLRGSVTPNQCCYELAFYRPLPA